MLLESATFTLMLQMLALSENVMERTLLSFSFSANGAKLLSTKVQRDDNIEVLHGIRFYSMMFVIFGHAGGIAVETLTLRKSTTRPDYNLSAKT